MQILGERTRMACFSIWLQLAEITGEGCAMGLRNEQGPDQCQKKGFALYLESGGKRFKVLGKVLT